MVNENKTIGIIGLWHLGCVLSASWAKLNNKVIGFDYDVDRVKNLQNGIPPLFEPHLVETIQEATNNNLLSFSSDITALSSCDFIFLSYDTPVRDDDSSDISILEKAVHDVRSVVKNNAILIISSQSPVGCCKKLRATLQETNESLELAYSPENLRLGQAIDCYLNPGRIILGTANKQTEQKCCNLFKQITTNILTMNLESAETVKHGINSFLAMSVVFANHLSDICEISGANITDTIAGIKSDPRIGEKAYLSPGIGFSGGTLGRDLKVLDSINKENNGLAKLFGAIHHYNSERKFSIVKRINSLLQGTAGKTVGILGLTYKPGTSTLRRSIPLEITDLLLQQNARVKVYDPKADYSELSFSPAFKITNSIKELSSNTDILVLLTEWPEFKEYDWAQVVNTTNNKLFYDTKNSLNETQLKKIGFKYHSLRD